MKRRTWRYVFYIVGLVIFGLLLGYVIEETAKGSEVEAGSQSQLNDLYNRINELETAPLFPKLFKNSNTGKAMNLLKDLLEERRELNPQFVNELTNELKFCPDQTRSTWIIVKQTAEIKALSIDLTLQLQSKDAEIARLLKLLDDVYKKAQEDLKTEKCKSAEALEKLKQCQKEKDEALEQARKFELQIANLILQLQKAQKDLLEKDDLLKFRDREIARLKGDLEKANKTIEEKDAKIAELAALLAQKPELEKPQTRVAVKPKPFVAPYVGASIVDFIGPSPFDIIKWIKEEDSQLEHQVGGEIGAGVLVQQLFFAQAFAGASGDNRDFHISTEAGFCIKGFKLGIGFIYSYEKANPQIYFGYNGWLAPFIRILPDKDARFVQFGLNFKYDLVR